MKLLLFDIDGTLLKPIQSGRKHIEDVLEKLCGQPISTRGVPFSGRTDPQILEDTLLLSGFAQKQVDSLLPTALKQYTAHATYVSDEVEPLDGVRELLEYLHPNRHVQLALLTGNVRTTAYRKLVAVQLDHLFPFGAFGCDHADRGKLPAIAAARAQEYCSRTFSGNQIVIIGDSVHDVTCGREIGALSVAVATGFTSIQNLQSAHPGALLQDLTNIDDFCNLAGILRDSCKSPYLEDFC